MRSIFLALIGFGIAAARAGEPVSNAPGALNLTPRVTVRELEGLQFRQLSFDGKKVTVTYEPPRNWRTSSRGPAELKLYPAQVSQADATVEWLPGSGPVPTDAPGMEALKEEMRGLMPEESEEITFGEPEANPIRIGDCDTCEVTADFTTFGQRFRMSTLFVDLGPVRLRFRLCARVTDFPQLHPLFRASLYTWQATIRSPVASGTRLVESEPGGESPQPSGARSSETVEFRTSQASLRLAPRL